MSDQLVDPELVPLIAAFPAMELTADGLAATRAGVAATLAEAPPYDGPAIEVRSHTAPALSGGAPVRVVGYRPPGPAQPLPAILHIHGGGYVMGTPEWSNTANRLLAASLGCAIFSVDYRLAPETPHPGPVEDCYTALHWLHGAAAALGVDDTRIGIKGESAGGGLAAALALVARDRGGPAIAFQHLIYPMIDDRTCTTAEPNPFAGRQVWTASHNLFGWTALLGGAPGGAAVPAHAAAARAEDLAGLPPAFIAVGAIDLFVDENIEYARRLCRAGVAVELHVYPGAFHGFQMQAEARVSRAAERDSLDALRRSLHDAVRA